MHYSRKKGPTQMAYQVNRRREHVGEYGSNSTFRETENILSFSRSSTRDHGTTALDLVYQAAEVFSGMEDRARETEARAQSLCKSAFERLQVAESRVESTECARRDTIREANSKLQEASRALKQAQTSITAAEERATAAEFRAQEAEIQAQKASRELALVEEAIRKRLLCLNPETAGHLSELAV